MKKLLMILAGAALFSFQACQGNSSDSKVNTNENTRETSQGALDVGNDGSNTDSSNARMEEHTRMNQAADEAAQKR
jgi:hypothetical protein